ncbi:MAG: class I SAM-dependent methyltransferase [Oscillospiraceae bacterium]|nr:class I SAM-dependent methyltransferase [Oscillospiraceae bacterium]
MPDLNLHGIDNGETFDFGRTSANYAKFRDIYPPSFYAKLRQLGIGLPGQHVLDLGTGTGVLPRNLGGARYTGMDISPEQIAMARELSQGMDVEYHVIPAEKIDFAPSTFDAATAVQCFHYIDRAKFLPKLHQALKPGSLFAICAMDFLPYEDDIMRGSEALVRKHNPSWTSGNSPRKHKRDLGRAPWARPLFRVHKRVLWCEDVPFTRESWHGRMLTCRGAGGSLSEEAMAAFTADHWAYMQTLPEKFTVKHQVMMFILRRKP